MLSHSLLVFYRSLSRQRLYSALNVLGLAIGIAVFLVLVLVVRYENSFDRWLPHAEDVYRLDETWLFPGRPPEEEAGATFVARDLLLADFPQIAGIARTMDLEEPVSVGQKIGSEDVIYVDPNILNVITLPLITGDRETALSTRSSVVIAESIARKYFATVRAIGRTLSISRNGIKRDYTVSAIMKNLPTNTTLDMKILVPLSSGVKEGVLAFRSWGSDSGQTFLRFRTPADAETVIAGLRDFVNRRAAGSSDEQEGDQPDRKIRLSLVPLTDAHFHDADVPTSTPPGVDRRVILGMGAIGLLALIIAATNYVNLATARAGLRAREVAIRKVVGASRRMLVTQFLVESVALVALAALIGLALTELAIPFVNALGGYGIVIDYRWIVLAMAVLTVLVGTAAGFYPAMLLSAYQPAAVLASSRMPAGGRSGARLRGALVLAQFAGAIAFAISTLVIDAQSAFLRNADRGFDREGLIIIESLSAPELLQRQSVILDSLRRVPGVVSATISNMQPNSHYTNNTVVERPGLIGQPPELLVEVVGRDYFDTYGIHLVAGRLFNDAHPMDDRAGDKIGDHESSAILNQSGVHALGFSNPQSALGQALRISRRAPTKKGVTVIGVVRNVRFESPRDVISPEFYMYDTHGIEYGEAAIRFRGVSRAAMMERLQTAWRTTAPDNPFVASTADERLADYYKPEQHRASLFSAGALLAIGIACLGLYGLASFNTMRRLREIGIRKTLGASTRDVLTLLVLQLVRPVLLANLLAWPVAWAGMRGWLSSFDQRIALSPIYFVAVGAAALGLAITTVLGQAWLVARAKPAVALRYE